MENSILESSTQPALNKGGVSGSFLLRVCLSPFIFLYGCFLLMAGTIFPITILVLFSCFGLISTPIVWILKKSGTDIKYLEPFITNPFNSYGEFELNCSESFFLHVRNHFFGTTIHLWGAFAIVYHYIVSGKIFTGNE